MNAKEIAILIIFFLFGLPSLMKIFFWVVQSSNNPPPQNIEKATELMVEEATPWWLGTLEWLAGLPGIFGAVLIIALIFFLKWIGEIR